MREYNNYNNREERSEYRKDTKGAKGAKGGPRKRSTVARKPLAKFQLPKDTKIEYRNLALLQKFLTDRGKIVPRRISGVSAREQRVLGSEIKKARFLGLLSTGGIKK